MTEEQAENIASEGSVQTAAPQTPLGESHFWISSYPFFESTLMLVPGAAHTLDAPKPIETRRMSVTMRVYDSDGAEVNNARLEFPCGEIQLFEVEPLLGACKLESGLKHAHLAVSAAPDTGVYCRMHTRESAALLGEPLEVSAVQGAFFPLSFAADRSNLMCIINCGDSEAILRCRLFVGKRSPEGAWTIPAHASRVVSIEAEFRDYAAVEEGVQLQAYVRLGTKAGNLGVQLVERTEGPKDAGFFTALS